MSAELETAVRAAQAAGRLLIEAPEVFRRIRRKPEDHDVRDSRKGFVTEMDLRSEALIREILSAAFPDYGFLGEEGEPTGLSSLSVWVVDPLDGTLAYGRGLDSYATSIGLVREGVPVLGVVYCPASGELFQSERGGGAFRNGEPIGVSGEGRLEDAILSMDHRIFRQGNQPLATRDLVRRIRRLRVAESCSQELCHLACGRVDGVVRTMQPDYDFLMGRIIVEEAGGVMVDFSGEQITTVLGRQRRTDLLAGNPKIIGHLREYFAAGGAEEDHGR